MGSLDFNLHGFVLGQIRKIQGEDILGWKLLGQVISLLGVHVQRLTKVLVGQRRMLMQIYRANVLQRASTPMSEETNSNFVTSRSWERPYLFWANMWDFLSQLEKEFNMTPTLTQRRVQHDANVALAILKHSSSAVISALFIPKRSVHASQRRFSLGQRTRLHLYYDGYSDSTRGQRPFHFIHRPQWPWIL